MERQMRKRWWEEDQRVLRRMPDGFEIESPAQITGWQDNMQRWPAVSYMNIFNYLVMSQGVDGESMENYKSMDSYNYFKSQKVGALYISSPADGLIYVKGDVIPSLAVNSERHHAWALLTTGGVIETAGCTCKAGRGKSCSHAGAILWKLEHAASTGRSGEACTDRQQQWNQGTCKNIGPKRISQVRFNRHKQDIHEVEEVEEPRFVMPSTPQYLTHTDFKNSLCSEKCSVRNLAMLPGSMLYKALNTEVPEPTATCDLPHGDHTDQELNCRKCAKFFKKYIDIDAEQLERATLQQSNSKVWHDARKIRITASSAKKVPVRGTTDPGRFLREHLYPSFRGNQATRHGKENEPNALKELQDMGYDIVSSGTVMCPGEPWLSASPDGLVKNRNILVEVKCPMISGSDLTKNLEDGKTVCDIKLVNGKPVLLKNGSRGYFFQTQLGMKCTNTKQCVFFVWCKDRHILLNVEFEEDFVVSVVERLKRFFFTSMLPRVVDDFNDNRLTFCKQYMTLARSVSC